MHFVVYQLLNLITRIGYIFNRGYSFMYNVAVKTLPFTTSENATHEMLDARIGKIAIEAGMLPCLRDVKDTTPRMITAAEFVERMNPYLCMN